MVVDNTTVSLAGLGVSKTREILISAAEYLCDFLESTFGSVSESQKRKRRLKRSSEKQERLKKDEIVAAVRQRMSESREIRDAEATKAAAEAAKAALIETAQKPTGVSGRSPSCQHCGGVCYKTRESASNGVGCLLILIGLGIAVLGFWTIIAIPFGLLVMFWGVHVGTKCNGFWTCRKCGAQIPRKIGSFEFF
jgi:hypothetical protein